jgi:hypothetical protein
LRTPPDHGFHDEPTTPLGLSELLVTLRRLTRLLRGLEDLAEYGGQPMLRQSWGRISELLSDAERLALTGARPPSARVAAPEAARAADLVGSISRAGRLAEANTVGSARWWLAVQVLGRRGDEACGYLANLATDA